MAQVSINSDYSEWASSTDAGERARLLQSPCVDVIPKSEGEASPGDPDSGTTSTLGAVFIVVNACLGAGLLNFPAAFSTAGGVAAGIALQMVSACSGCGGRPCAGFLWFAREALSQTSHRGHMLSILPCLTSDRHYQSIPELSG